MFHPKQKNIGCLDESIAEQQCDKRYEARGFHPRRQDMAPVDETNVRQERRESWEKACFIQNSRI